MLSKCMTEEEGWYFKLVWVASTCPNVGGAISNGTESKKIQREVCKNVVAGTEVFLGEL